MKAVAVPITLAVFLLCCLMCRIAFGAGPVSVEQPEQHDRSRDRYATISFGTQPLAMPIGVIGEVMRRDRILRRALGEKGYRIYFHPFLKGSDISSLVARQRIDAAMIGDMPTIVAASEFGIQAVALAKQGFSSIVTTGHYTMAGLKGKRIAYPPVSNAHYALLSALAASGLKESDVKMVPMDVNRMVEALASKEVDAIAAWEPIPTIAVKTVDGAASIYRCLNSSYLVLGKGLAERHPDAAALIVASFFRALDWMGKSERNLNRAAEWTLASATRLQRGTIPLSAADIALLTMQDAIGIISSPLIPTGELQENGTIWKKFEFLKKEGKIPGCVSWSWARQHFDRLLPSRVLRRPKAYQLESFDYNGGSAD